MWEGYVEVLLDWCHGVIWLKRFFLLHESAIYPLVDQNTSAQTSTFQRVTDSTSAGSSDNRVGPSLFYLTLI
jgi:hypothetical protein